jgi:glycosyltransferase involved in cell wall biosynthesis
MSSTQSAGARWAPPLAPPRVSVVIPAFLSHDTVGRCLEGMLAQDLGSGGEAGFEVVVVDSSPDERTAEVVRRYPAVRFVRSPRRLLPHAARNEGVRHARGELLVFTDPDIYPPPDWLSRLVAARRATGHVVVGALACHGGRWLDHGIHLCKFAKWLPGGAPRPVDMSPTANMLIDRAGFDAMGGFDGEHMLGDAEFSWRLLDTGRTLWFDPAAGADHHHVTGFRAFLRERHRRGVEFGDLRIAWERHDRRRALLYLAASLLPVRLVRIVVLTLGHSRRSGQIRRCLSTLPVWLAGHAASLLGESRAYLRRALRPAITDDAEDAPPAEDGAAQRARAENARRTPHPIR